MKLPVLLVLLTYGCAAGETTVDATENTSKPLISESRVDAALAQAQDEVHLRRKRNADFETLSNVTRKVYNKPAPEVAKLIEVHQVLDRATEILKEKYNVDHREASHAISKRTTIRKEFEGDVLCQKRITYCNFNWRYRLQDGSCNNVRDPNLGRAIVTLDRILPAVYSDNFDGSFRLSVTGAELPNPRTISVNIHPDISRPHPLITHMVVGYGQMTDHDIAATPEYENLGCCNTYNENCMEIRFTKPDPFYSQFGVDCIDLGRSVRACSSQPREQINQATAFIDGSEIYGNSFTEQLLLRQFSSGLLKSGFNSKMLPPNYDVTRCGLPLQNKTCFLSGDLRVNENPALTSMQTMMFREHNRIASELKKINPMWGDDILFEETKRIVIAELQNIIFSEFLPVVLGDQQMNAWGLILPYFGYTAYDPSIRPNILNSFATGAFRFAHTLIQNVFQLFGNGNFRLELNFENPELVYKDEDNVDRIILGLTQQAAQSYENYVSQALTNHVLQLPGTRYGKDLVALNIQRGRDHGLPPYNDFREICGLPRATFDDLSKYVFSQDTAQRFQRNYAHIDDVDLWPGGISENSVPGGLVGPTFSCIIGQQFFRLMKGDRYFFTHFGQPGSFMSNQLANIRQRTLAGIICDNLELASQLQRNVFLKPGSSNSIIACDKHPKLDLNLFRMMPGSD